MILAKTYHQDLKIGEEGFENKSRGEINNFFQNLDYFLADDANVSRQIMRTVSLLEQPEFATEDIRVKLIYWNFWSENEILNDTLELLLRFWTTENSRIYQAPPEDILAERKRLPDSKGKRYAANVTLLILTRKIKKLGMLYKSCKNEKDFNIVNEEAAAISEFLTSSDFLNPELRVERFFNEKLFC